MFVEGLRKALLYVCMCDRKPKNATLSEHLHHIPAVMGAVGLGEQFEKQFDSYSKYNTSPSAVHCLIQPVIIPKELVSTAVDKMASSCSS